MVPGKSLVSLWLHQFIEHPSENKSVCWRSSYFMKKVIRTVMFISEKPVIGSDLYNSLNPKYNLVVLWPRQFTGCYMTTQRILF
jgi:hypothetical protein